ncbi:MAG: hypothetical protein WDO19_00555 [Bacteroidota bacterium]
MYDAHELFCEMQEIVSRPFIYKAWKRIERFSVPSFPNGYTVNNIIADEFRKMYNVKYDVIKKCTGFKRTHRAWKKREVYTLPGSCE